MLPPAGDNSDVTVQLPDEVLCHIFSFLSLSHKLRLESVNHKFQRCILNELKANPQPLEVDLNYHKLNGNGAFRLNLSPIQDLFDAVQTLAKKAKFSTIGLRGGGVLLETLDQLLFLLISQNQCLTKVTSFRCDSGCTQAVLKNFLDKCVKISSIRFDFDIRPLYGITWLLSEPNFPLDLYQLFKNRGLTELVLRLFDYHQNGLTHMLQGIKPNTLRKLDLCFSRLHNLTELNIVEFVNALAPSGSALEEIHFKFRFPLVRVQLAALFKSLSRLPALCKCDIQFCRVGPGNQFVAAMTSLLFISDINITVTLTAPDSDLVPDSGCQAVNMFQQIQNVHPGLVVDFDRAGSLILSLGNASLVVKGFLRLCVHCGAGDCVQCQSFYPSLLDFLDIKAAVAASNFVEAQHLPNCRLDRCRVGVILDDLNALVEPDCRALSVQPNEDQQSLTINFEGINVMPHHLFSITIGCGHCLTDGCEKCEN